MNHSESWRVALQALRADKVKAALTMIGVVMGSAAIVLVVTVAMTGKRYIIAQIEGVGSNLVYGYLLTSTTGQNTPLGDQISLEDLEAIRREVPQARYIAGTHDLLMPMVVAGKERAVTVIGVTPEFQQIRNLLIIKGRYFDPVDFSSYSKGALVSEQLAKQFLEDPVGRNIRVGELNFTVIGTFRERVATFGQSEITAETVMIPFPLIRYYASQDYVRTFYVQAKQGGDVPLVTAKVKQLLETRHRAEAVYVVENLSSLLAAAGTISLALTIILLLVAAIALTISGVGIMNIMLVTVTERTREIGVRMSLGARRREIQYQFLLEAFLISGTGALIGIGIALLIPVVAQPFLPGNFHIPTSGLSVGVAFIVTVGVGVLFGYLPATRASRLQPTEALRYE